MDATTAPVCLAALAVILCAVLAWRSAKKQSRVAALVNKLPGPPAYPIIGTVLDIIMIPRENLMEEVLARQKRYLPIFRTWLGSHPGINICLPEHLEVIMSSSKHLEKGSIYKLLHPWLGTGLLTSSGLKWHSHRKLLTPAFHFAILHNFVEVFCEKSRILVDKLRARAGGGGFDVYPYITRCTLDIICETTMGTKVYAQDVGRSKYVEAVYGVAEELTYRFLRPWLHFDFIYMKTQRGRKFRNYLKVLHNFTRKIIEERKSYIATNAAAFKENSMSDSKIGTKKRIAFLDLLLQSSMSDNHLTDEEIREEVDTFMFEGHDTTASAISWCLFLLGLHPDVQALAYEEQEKIFQGSDRPATMQNLQDMKYLERVIKETLRLYPSVHFIARLLQSDVKLGQRFALLEEKVVLSSLLRNFKVRSLEARSNKMLSGELILRPAHGIQVSLTLRSPS
ncbi:cytochrome P450 4C1-like isoform X2 [Bacillus rossius redtenbacheri]|uniref:cytochrome P450 4C1-like isoform X2 n=1 Tax=Bacillus rossius redtenbacheri TaxID=93214 RepID=UPI002FDE3C87